MARGNKLGAFGLFIIGVAFIGMGLAIVYYLGKDINLTCNRSTDKCIIAETNIFNETEIIEELQLKKIAGAEVIQKRDSDGDYTYKVMLITNQGRIPLSNMSTNDHSSHRKTAVEINNFVNSKMEKLEILQSGNLAKIIGFVFAGIGVLMFLGSLAGIFKLAALLFIMLASRKK